MQTLAIDIETYCEADIKKSGLYRYVDDPSFDVIILAYSLNESTIQLLDLNDSSAKAQFADMLLSPEITKTAWNAAFEITCLEKYFGVHLNPLEWHCTMVKAAQMGLPLSLDRCAKALGVDQQKNSKGQMLIRLFSCPVAPSLHNQGTGRNSKQTAPDLWAQFEAYCCQDVRTEQSVRLLLDKYKTQERTVWAVDQQINRRGVMIDTELAEAAIELSRAFSNKRIKETIEITGIDNPNSPVQIKKWLSEKLGKPIKTLDKAAIADLLEETDDIEVIEALEARADLGKSSIAKYESMLNSVCYDGRIRGLFQYYGSRTGRWAGRLVQVQNLPSKKVKAIAIARELVKQKNYESLDILYESIPSVLSAVIRPSFIPAAGKKFIVSDFSAIEARVIAWLAGEAWRLEVFKTHGKIYEASAAKMFNVPIESVTKGSDLRQRGKIAELALGYQGAVGALSRMGAVKMGVPKNGLQDLVDAWRRANPAICRFWTAVESAAKRAISSGVQQRLGDSLSTYNNLLLFDYDGDHLFITLPSGRALCYWRSRIDNEGNIVYQGTEAGAWAKISTYGGKLVENIVQAVARDLLVGALIRLEGAGLPVVMHVHDEAVIEAEKDVSVEKVTEIMQAAPSWAAGLPINADSFETEFYIKD